MTTRIPSPPPRYAELRAKSCFSFLRGASHPEELVERAAELGLSALAITDRNGVYGAARAHQEAKKHPDLKLIVGSEVIFRDGPPITLLSTNRAAYGLMCRLLTEVHRGEGRILEPGSEECEEPGKKDDRSIAWASFRALLGKQAHREALHGLIALPDPGRESYGDLKELFSAGNRLYLPLWRALDGRDAAREARVRDLSSRWAIPIVATNDVHVHVASRSRIHDVMTAARHNVTLETAGRRVFSNAEKHLKSGSEMAALFSGIPEALERTLEIADRCAFQMSELKYRYPSEWIPSEHSSRTYLRELVERGARERYTEGVPADVRAVLEHELRLIEELDYADYFLTIQEIVAYARSRGILCQGRGSAANSAVCYCLGITSIDPVRMNLLFERFLSKEREEPPDIDVDFEHERREEVIQWVYEKYGRHRAAMVCTYVTYRSKGALREVRKAFGYADGDPIGDPDKAKLVAALAEELYGFPRHLSIHSGGFTLSADDLIEIVPVEPATMEGRTVIQWDKNDLEGLGLLKVDLLSLGMLTAIHRTFDSIANPALQFHTVPADDPQTYAMIQAADTVGVFQIESRAQMNMLGRLQPENFYDLVIEVALVRPGPIVGKMVHPDLKRRRGEEPIDLPHPDLAPILGKTLGVPIFQEQVMKMAIVLADFTPGEADQLRRAIAAWRSAGSIEVVGERLRQGLLKKGLPAEFVDRVFQQIKGFSEYGFPESHAASFALIAYVSCYLKCHYPAEFTAALINSQPMGFYPAHTLLDDAKRHGVPVLPLDINRSDWDCTLEEADGRRSIRMGLRLARTLGESSGRALVEERRRAGPFQGVRDFMNRVPLRSNSLHALARGDAFAPFGADARHALWQVLEHELLLGGDAAGAPKQLNLFSLLGAESSSSPAAGVFPPIAPLDQIQMDYEILGASHRAHPMQALRWRFKNLPRATSREVREAKAGQYVQAAGLVLIRQRPPTARGMVFATLEDEHGFLDLALQPQVYERTREVFMNQCFLVMSGTLQRDRHTVSVLVRQIRPIWADLAEAPAIARRVDTRTYFHG
ncbi:MAG: PHP domain-containing protein [Bdellovibrionales bacterium]|nr:PHP domain-containing protein [Bdellovibrionales bacterium]